MIGCVTKNGVEYITKVEDFRALVDEQIYNALVEFLQTDKIQYIDEIDELKSEVYQSDEAYTDLQHEFDNLQATYDEYMDSIRDICNLSEDLSKTDILEKLSELI